MLKKITLLIFVTLILVGFYIRNKYFDRSLSYAELADYAYETVVLENGMQVNYRIDGNPKGRTLLLIHGGFDSLDGWEDWIPMLAQEFRIVSVDMPGHGLTDPLPDRNYTRYGMAAFIQQFVTALELQDFVIIGHSMGGEYSLQYAIENPERIVGIVIVAAGGYVDDVATVETEQQLLALANSPIAPLFYTYGTRESTNASFAEYLAIDPDEQPDFFERIYRLSRYEKHRDTALKLVSSMYANPHNLRGLDTISVPTLIMWGDQDTIALPEHAQRFHNDINNSTLLMYEGVAHGLQLETGETGAQDVVEFLKHNDLHR
ncbi:MAG: alpha/beta hydrolase [Chloroflexota bacterium]